MRKKTLLTLSAHPLGHCGTFPGRPEVAEAVPIPTRRARKPDWKTHWNTGKQRKAAAAPATGKTSPPAPRACSPTRSPFQLRSERVTLQCRLHLGKATGSPFHCHICAATAEMAFGWEISSGYAEGRGRGEVGACLIGSQQSGQLFSGV